MMVKWVNDANDGEMLVDDGEMLVNDGEISVWSYTYFTIIDEHFTIIIEHFTIINEHLTIINEQFTLISLKVTIIPSFDHHREAAPTVMILSHHPPYRASTCVIQVPHENYRYLIKVKNTLRNLANQNAYTEARLTQVILHDY